MKKQENNQGLYLDFRNCETKQDVKKVYDDKIEEMEFDLKRLKKLEELFFGGKR